VHGGDTQWSREWSRKMAGFATNILEEQGHASTRDGYWTVLEIGG